MSAHADERALHATVVQSEPMNWHGVALLSLVVGSMTGCGSAASDDAQQDRESHPAVLTMPPGWSFFPQAGVSGELTVEAGCILIDGYLAIWPDGTAWDASAEAVTFSDVADASVGIGERFAGAGGRLPDRVYDAELDSEDADAMNRCLAETDALGPLFAYPEG